MQSALGYKQAQGQRLNTQKNLKQPEGRTAEQQTQLELSFQAAPARPSPYLQEGYLAWTKLLLPNAKKKSAVQMPAVSIETGISPSNSTLRLGKALFRNPYQLHGGVVVLPAPQHRAHVRGRAPAAARHPLRAPARLQHAGGGRPCRGVSPALRSLLAGEGARSLSPVGTGRWESLRRREL